MNELVNSISISNSGDIKNTNLFPPPIPQNIPSFQFSSYSYPVNNRDFPQPKLKLKSQSNDIQPSSEQLTIINDVINNNNLVIDSVAGSGKTTTILFLAKELANKKILQVTYNVALKEEVEKRKNKMGLSNLYVYTYHGLLSKIMKTPIHNDNMFNNYLSQNIEPDIFYDIIIVDEIQDMKYDFFVFMKKYIEKHPKQTITIVMGDKYQCINKFTGADSRYLTLWPKIINDNKTYLHRKLSISYRLSNQLAQFLNEGLLGYDFIKGSFEGEKCQYIIDNPISTKLHKKLAKWIDQNIKSGMISASDVFIINYTTKSTNNTPTRLLANELGVLGIGVYYPTNEEEELKDDIIKNKVVISTINQTKGRERRIVILFGFDFYYFEKHIHSKKHLVCPDIFYVALTRSSEILLVVQSNKSKAVPCLKFSTQELHKKGLINLHEYQDEIKGAKTFQNQKSFIVTDLIKYIGEIEVEINNILNSLYSIEQSSSENINLENKVLGTHGNEEISHINGIYLPALYQQNITKKSEIIDELAYYQSLGKNKILDNVKWDNLTLQSTSLYYAYRESVNIYYTQLNSFNWITKEQEQLSLERLSKHITKNAKYEVSKFKDICIGDNSYDIKGCIDCIDDNVVWEFKCKKDLSFENKLQLLFYAYLVSDANKQYKLFNITTNEILVLKYNLEKIENVIKNIINYKLKTQDEISDDTFIQKHLYSIENVYNLSEDDLDTYLVGKNKICEDNLFASIKIRKRFTMIYYLTLSNSLDINEIKKYGLDKIQQSLLRSESYLEFLNNL